MIARSSTARVGLPAIGAVSLMMVFQAFQLDITSGWKEILLVLVGVLSVSLSKLIDHWYANDERESDLLESAQD